MSELNEPAPSARRNPLIWIVLVVVGLILFVFLSGDRGDLPGSLKVKPTQDSAIQDTAGAIDRSLLVPPGMRARQYIEQLRSAGKPYPLSQVFDKAESFRGDGSLADAHLLFFFAARENYLPAMMAMAEMSDPMRFRAEDSLLDQADAIQAWKWYRKAADLGQPIAVQRLDELSRWAGNAAANGDPKARQLLLNIQ